MHPRRACAALVAALQAKGVQVVAEAADEGAVVWATGWQGLHDLTEGLGRKVGDGVKGQAALLRSGLPTEAIDAFLQSARPKISANMVVLPEGEIFSVIGLGKYLMSHDPALADFLKNQGQPLYSLQVVIDKTFFFFFLLSMF